MLGVSIGCSFSHLLTLPIMPLHDYIYTTKILHTLLWESYVSSVFIVNL